MKILFMGTPDFAVESLAAMVENNYDVVGVITQPDKPKGRGYKLEPTPVKKYAISKGIKVYQPTILKDNAIFDLLNELSPELIIVTAYGKILPKYLLDFPKYGCINIHASLLPSLRGAAPIQWSIINGLSKTGITSMYMAEKLDAGDMLLSMECEISITDNAGSLHNKLMAISGKVLLKTLNAVENGTLNSHKQDESLVTYASMLNNENTKLDFNASNIEVYNKIRGLSPFPSAKTSLNEVNFKILSASLSDKIIDRMPGSIIIEKNEVFVCCKDSATIILLEIIATGGKKMNALDYFNGHKLNEMEKFQ